jgi:membrane-associated phospholipid phosphatase
VGRAAEELGIGFFAVAAVLILVGLLITHVFTASVGRWDEHINALFVGHRTPTDDRITADLTFLANTPGIAAVALVVSAVAIALHRAARAALIIVALAVELSAFLSVNYLVARPRPDVVHVGSTPSTFSWPSGHVAATVVLYGGTALIISAITSRVLPRLVAWAVAVVLTAGVGLSRVYRGEHHPTDAMAGLVLGVAALYIASRVVRAWSAAPETSAPDGPGSRSDGWGARSSVRIDERAQPREVPQARSSLRPDEMGEVS